MLSRLFNKKRDGDDSGTKERTDRFMKRDGYWYFRTREGFDVGPFDGRSEAQYALLYFVESHEWPTDEQLADFIEGCKLMNGAA